MTVLKRDAPKRAAGGLLLLALLAASGPARAQMPRGFDPAAWARVPKLSGLAAAPPMRNGPDDAPPVVTAGFGPLTVRAAAAEAPDYSGYPGDRGAPPPRITPDGWALTGPNNLDSHRWTGAPALRFLLAARNVSRDSLRQDWVVEVDRVSPQWGGPLTVRAGTAAARPLDVFPVYNPQNLPAGSAWVAHDFQVADAAPERQRWVEISGTAIRSAWHAETVTFHDAEVVRDAAFGGDRLVWDHPETETTASGISVSVLNGRPGVPDLGAGQPYDPVWDFAHGSAEMLLAWRLPPGVVSEEHAGFEAPRVANAPKAEGAFGSEWDCPRPWRPLLRDALAAPGGQDMGALERAGYAPLRFSLRSNVWPPWPPPGPLHDGFFQFKPVPLPAHLKTITLRVFLREEQERHPFRLCVPVRAAFPPGWDADAADSRSRAGA